MHKHAKVVLKRWLEAGDLEPIWVQGNVHVEYPLAKFNHRILGRHPIWRENETWLSLLGRQSFRVPTFNELIQLKWYPYVIFDVVAEYKGDVHQAIEVIQSHSIKPDKLAKLKKLDNIEIWSIDAEWIMRQVKRPKQLKVTLVLDQ